MAGWAALVRFQGGSNPFVKPALALALFAISSVANAVTLVLIRHNQTSDTAVSTLVSDGADGNPATNAVFDWDGTTLTSTGLYSVTSHLSSNPFAPSVIGDRITDLSIDTGTSTATATTYECDEGTFLAGVGANGCGGYSLGANFVDESTTVWSGLSVSQTIGGDDISDATIRTIAEYDFGLDGVTGSGMSPGDQVTIGNGLPVVPGGGGEAIIFQVVVSAVDDTASGAPATAINIPVLANDALVDDIATLTTSSFSAGGSAVVVGTLPGAQAGISIDYTSAVGFVGDETFDYSVTDGNSDTVGATVTVSVTDTVVATDDGDAITPFATVAPGATVTLDVLANDLGLSDTPLTVVAPVNTNPGLGMAAVTGSPGDATAIRIDYTAGQTAGFDAFGYQVSDNGGTMDSATVFVEVVVPSVPVAVDDAAATILEQKVAIDVLANDTNLDDAPLTVTITSDPASGTIGAIVGCTQQGAACEVPYTPAAGFAGTDTFQYMVTDSTPDDSNVATVTVTVNDVPVAADDTASTTNTAPVTIDVLANDTGLGFTPLVVDVVTNAAFRGTAVVQPDNTILFTPSGGAEREDVFDYMVTDANGGSSMARVRVAITPTQTDLAGESSALGPVGLGLLALMAWLRRRLSA